MFKKYIPLTTVLVIPFISLLINLKTIKDYGINWDEPYHYKRGQAFLQFFLTGKKTYDGIPKYKSLKGTSDDTNFRNSEELFINNQKNPDPKSVSFRRSYYQDDAWNGEYFIDQESSYGHPPLNDILAAFSNYIFYQKLGIVGDLESYHLFIVLTVSTTIFLVALFMWKEFGLIESVITSLSLVTYPLLLGEQHFNIKDPIEAAFYTLTIIFFYLGITKKSFGWLFGTVVMFALALSTKFNILFSTVPMGLWLVYYLYTNKQIDKKGLLKKIGLISIIAPIIILGILILSFPTIWKNPIAGLLEISRFYLEAGHSISQPVSYYILGFINTYPIQWITFTTPPIVIVLFIFGIFLAKKFIKINSFFLLLILWFITNIGRISLFGALSYGGARLIMEYIPAMAMIAGIAGGFLIRVAKKTSCGVVLSFVIILGFVPTLIKLVNIHPNENIYFNFLIGGLSGAKIKNINSWGNTNGNAYYPGIQWLNKNAEKDTKLTLPVNLIGNLPRYKLRGDIALSDTYWSGPGHNGEYIIELTYDYPPMTWYALNYLNTVMDPVYEVKADTVALAKVWKNDDEHVKTLFRNQSKITLSVKIDKNTLRIDLPKSEKLMQISIPTPTVGCSPVKTGYVRTSVNGVDWIREPEDIALDQIKQSKFRGISSQFDFYFVAREARSIIFEIGGENVCPLKSTRAEVTVLN